jgi:ABC-2 type transport system ATP-binding protein
MTIFLTTQYLEEADQLADVVAIIDKGKIVAQGSPTKLKASVGPETINLAFEDRETAERAATALREMSSSVQADRDVVRLYIEQAAQRVPKVVDRLQGAQISPLSLTITQPTLDDVFLQVTGQRLEAEKQPQKEPA